MIEVDYVLAVPERLKGRPTYRGMVIPDSAYVGPDGVPDFKVLDDEKRRAHIANRTCAICGERIGYWIAFVGGRSAIEKRLFIDPGMHEDCARYSAAHCPFLNGTHRQYATTVKPKEDVTISEVQAIPQSMSDRIGILVTRKYQPVIIRTSEGQQLAILAAPGKFVQWFREAQ